MTTLRSMLLAPRKAFSELKLLGLLWGANLLVTLIQSTPVLFAALARFGHSLSGRGKPFPSIEALSDFGRQLAQGSGPFLLGPLLLGLVLSLGVQLVLTGGIVARLCSPERFTLALFVRDCAAQLPRNLRLLGWALLGLLPVVGLAALTALLLSRLHEPTLFTLKGEEGIIDNPITGWSMAHLMGVLVLFALWRSSFDLARVQLFAEDQRKTRLAAWRALKQMVRSPRAVLGYIVLSGVGLLGVFVFARLHSALQVTSAARAWLALLLAQVVVLTRLGFSVTTTAFTVEIHRAMPRWTDPAPAPAGPAARVEPAPVAPEAPAPGDTSGELPPGA